MFQKKLIVATLTAAALSGCNGLFSEPLAVPVAGPTGKSSIVDTRAFVLPRCPISKQSGEAAGIVAAIAGIVVPILVDKGFDFLSSELSKAAGEKSVSTTAIANGNFYSQHTGTSQLSLESRTKCLVVVRGVFGGATASFTADEMQDPEVASALKSLGLAGDPHFYLEATINTSQEKSAFKLVAQRFIFNVPMNRDLFGLRKGSNKDVAVSMVFQTPSKSAEEAKKTSFGGGALSFESLTPGKYLSEAALNGKETAWIPTPKVEAAKVKAVQKLTAGQSKSIAPFTIVVTVTETRDASKILQLISQVFEGSKAEAAKVVVNYVEEKTGLKKKDAEK